MHHFRSPFFDYPFGLISTDPHITSRANEFLEAPNSAGQTNLLHVIRDLTTAVDNGDKAFAEAIKAMHHVVGLNKALMEQVDLLKEKIDLQDKNADNLRKELTLSKEGRFI